jgi:hypothetical protein
MLKPYNAANFDMICGLEGYVFLEEYWRTCYKFLCTMNSENLNWMHENYYPTALKFTKSDVRIYGLDVPSMTFHKCQTS